MHSPMNTRLYWIRRYVGNFVNIQKKVLRKVAFFYLQHVLSQKSRDMKLSMHQQKGFYYLSNKLGKDVGISKSLWGI